ncbi:hypothetical protein D3C85_1734390 [compost metagenome]
MTGERATGLKIKFPVLEGRGLRFSLMSKPLVSIGMVSTSCADKVFMDTTKTNNKLA